MKKDQLRNPILIYESALEEKLSKTQRASSNHSLSWKHQSKVLLETDDETDFCNAVKWCGNNGNVARTVDMEEVRKFAEVLFKHKKDICSGEYWGEKIELKRKPYSWISKICHIINPKMYPIIYDEYNKKTFGFNTFLEYKRIVEELRNYSKNKSDEELYEIDAILWAKQLPYQLL